MRAWAGFTRLVAGELLALPSQLADGLCMLPAYLRDPIFWRVQAMVGAITLLHYVIVALEYYPPYLHLPIIAPALYSLVIVYSSMHCRRQGALVTGLWCVLLTLPIIVVWPQARLEWLTGLSQVATGVAVGLVMARVVEHEAAQRRRAEEMSSRLVVLHQQVAHAQEEERRRIARELHDETIQSLVLVCQGLDKAAATGRLPRTSLTSLRDVRSKAEEALEGVRRFSLDLRPPMLDDLGLVAAVEWITTELAKRQGVDVHVEVAGDPRRLSPEAELALFRIAQEALRNVEKHAEASQVIVDLAFFEQGRLRLSVRDNGKGFEPPHSLHDLEPNGNLGLVGMHERAQLLGSRLELRSGRGRGTSVTVTLDR